jgi:hypothetical protein
MEKTTNLTIDEALVRTIGHYNSFFFPYVHSFKPNTIAQYVSKAYVYLVSNFVKYSSVFVDIAYMPSYARITSNVEFGPEYFAYYEELSRLYKINSTLFFEGVEEVGGYPVNTLTTPDRFFNRENIETFQKQGLLEKNIPGLHKADITALKLEAEKFIKFCNLKDMHEKFPLLAFYAIFFQPKFLNLLENNIDFFKSAGKILINGTESENLYIGMFNADSNKLGGISLHKDYDNYFAHQYNIKANPISKKNVAYQLSLTESNEHNAPLYIWKTIDYGFVSPRCSFLRMQDVLLERYGEETVLKALAISEKGAELFQTIQSSVSFLLIFPYYKKIRKGNDEKAITIENEAGEGFFFLPQAQYHGVFDKADENHSRITSSIRIFTDPDSYQNLINREEHSIETLSKIFGISEKLITDTLKVKDYVLNCIELFTEDSSKKNSCVTIDNLKNFYNIPEVRMFFLGEEYQQHLEL